MKRWRLLRMICALLGLVAVLLSLSLIKVPAELPGGSETSTVEHVSGHDCVRFVDYDSDGKVVESDYVIGTADFTFMAWLEPRRLEYSMILSRDRAGEPADQFRIAMWNDGRIGISAASSSPAVKYDLPYPSAVDFQGWGSHFTTQLPLEPDRKAFFALARRGPEWAIFLDGKHAMAGGWRRHENASTTDLRFYENRNLRLGTRYPQLPSLLSPSARVVQDPFPGTIRDVVLHIGIAMTEAQIQKGLVPCAAVAIATPPSPPPPPPLPPPRPGGANIIRSNGTPPARD